MTSASGELWLPVRRITMSTAIISFLTPEGFVIGSDGRDTDSNGHVLTDAAQKIFPIDHSTGQLALGLAGTIKIGPSEDIVVFNFELAAKRAGEFLAKQKIPNWWAYTNAFTCAVLEPLSASRKASNYRLDKVCETWLFLGGVFGKHLKSAHLHFQHGLTDSDAEPYLHPPGFHGPFGSGKVLALIDEEDPRFLQYAKPKRLAVATLSDAVTRTRNDILAHYDPEALRVDESTCRGIGGRVQIATVTFQAGFRWVPGHEPLHA